MMSDSIHFRDMMEVQFLELLENEAKEAFEVEELTDHHVEQAAVTFSRGIAIQLSTAVITGYSSIPEEELPVPDLKAMLDRILIAWSQIDTEAFEDHHVAKTELDRALASLANPSHVELEMDEHGATVPFWSTMNVIFRELQTFYSSKVSV